MPMHNDPAAQEPDDDDQSHNPDEPGDTGQDSIRDGDAYPVNIRQWRNRSNGQFEKPRFRQ